MRNENEDIRPANDSTSVDPTILTMLNRRNLKITTTALAMISLYSGFAYMFWPRFLPMWLAGFPFGVSVTSGLVVVYCIYLLLKGPK